MDLDRFDLRLTPGAAGPLVQFPRVVSGPPHHVSELNQRPAAASPATPPARRRTGSAARPRGSSRRAAPRSSGRGGQREQPHLLAEHVRRLDGACRASPPRRRTRAASPSRCRRALALAGGRPARPAAPGCRAWAGPLSRPWSSRASACDAGLPGPRRPAAARGSARRGARPAAGSAGRGSRPAGPGTHPSGIAAGGSPVVSSPAWAGARRASAHRRCSSNQTRLPTSVVSTPQSLARIDTIASPARWWARSRAAGLRGPPGRGSGSRDHRLTGTGAVVLDADPDDVAAPSQATSMKRARCCAARRCRPARSRRASRPPRACSGPTWTARRPRSGGRRARSPAPQQGGAAVVGLRPPGLRAPDDDAPGRGPAG